MRCSDAGLRLIAEFEGLATEPYQDVGGKWTIGFGHLLKPGEPRDNIDEAEAMRLLCRDVQEAEACIVGCVDVPLTQNQFDALVSFCFNCGCAALKRSTLLKYLNAEDWTAASNEFPKWSRVGTKQVSGLLRRRLAEQLLFESI